MSVLFKCLPTIALVMTSLTSMTSLAKEYVGQVRIYVDKAGVDKWTGLTGKSQVSDFWHEMNSTFFEINQLLKTLEPHVSVQLQIEDIFILKQNILAVDLGGNVINWKSLEQFEAWMITNHAKDQFDLAILYTGYNLMQSQIADHAYGYSYISTVCSAKALGVVELKATYDDVLATAHEIGHILGANHDGTHDALECNSKSGKLMNTYTIPTSPNHFSYSSCTAKAIYLKLETLTNNNNNCMTSWSRSSDISGPRYGTLLAPDDFCRRVHGPHSYIAREEYKSYGDEACLQLACVTSTSGRSTFWQFIHTPQGLNCGKNKQCIQGRCVESSTGSPYVNDKCPFGDSPKLSGDTQRTCSQITLSECNQHRQTCCQTCYDPGTSDEVCTRLEGTHSALARGYYSSYGNELCSNLVCLRNDNRANNHTAPNGMKCGKNKRCNNGLCVYSKVGDPDVSDSCPYGDQPWLDGALNTTCEAYIRQNGCTGVWKNMCCGSCNDPGTADEVCKGLEGNSSSLARSYYSGYGDELCTHLACLTSVAGNQFYWRTHTTPNGMKCGRNKRCMRGRCLWTVTGDPNLLDTCPYGDQPWLGGMWQTTCDDYIGHNGCSGQGWKSICCGSCHEPGTADDVCRDLVGNHSSMARLHYSSYGDELCSNLMCVTSVVGTNFHWTNHTAPDGMKCGKNKRCKQGKCLQSATGDPKMSDTCPYGDQPWLGGIWQTTCDAYIRQNGCSGPGWSKICCGSCYDPGTADEICQDLQGNTSAFQRTYYNNYGDELCTRLACSGKVQGTYFTWKYHPAPDGMKCGKNKRCMNGKCLWTTTGDPNMSDTCPYGDQPWLGGDYQTTCDRFIIQNGCMDRILKKTCCESCSGKDPGTADEVCRALVGNHSAMARFPYSSYGDDLCSSLKCLTSNEGTSFKWSNHIAPERMKCGENKRCSKGKCLQSATGDPKMSSTCPYGDQPWLGGVLQTTCDAYIKQHGCSGPHWKNICCGSCDPGTADQVCQRLEGNASAMARFYYGYYGDELCSKLACLTKVEGHSFYWKYYTAPDGMKCGKNKRCSNGQCVWSSNGDADMSDQCPYGDQPWLAGTYRTSCTDFVNINGCTVYGFDKLCCSSCRNTNKLF